MIPVLVGDYAVRDLSPKGMNVGGFLHKNMRIAGSGVYQYHRSEAPLFGLVEDALPRGQMMFGIYRPPEVLKANKELFARVPIITGRHIQITTENAKQHMVGFVGDSIVDEVDPNDGELYLYATGTITAGDGVDMYENYGQLSVGYVPSAKWEAGEHKGEKYDAVLTGFKDVNHLLLCREARGGPQCMVMDSLDDGGSTVFNNIFKRKKPAVPPAGDARVPVLLQSIAAGADPEIQVKAIRGIVGDSKNQDWETYLDELSKCKDEHPEVKTAAVQIVSDFYVQEMCGDSKDEPDDKKPAGDSDDKKEPGDSDDKKEPGDSDDKKEPDTTPKPDSAGKDKADDSVGDSTLLSEIKAIRAEIEALKASKEPPSVQQNDAALGALRMLIAGDSNAKLTSDDFMKSLIGGK
jgi:hypothetical protein